MSALRARKLYQLTLCPGRAQGAKLHAAEQDESLGKPHSHYHPAHGRTDMRMRLRDGHTSQAPQMRRHCCGDCTGQDTHVHIKVRMTRLPCWCALHGAAQQHFNLKIRLCRPLQSCMPSLRVRNAAVKTKVLDRNSCRKRRHLYLFGNRKIPFLGAANNCSPQGAQGRQVVQAFMLHDTHRCRVMAMLHVVYVPQQSRMV